MQMGGEVGDGGVDPVVVRVLGRHVPNQICRSTPPDPRCLLSVLDAEAELQFFPLSSSIIQLLYPIGTACVLCVCVCLFLFYARFLSLL